MHTSLLVTLSRRKHNLHVWLKYPREIKISAIWHLKRNVSSKNQINVSPEQVVIISWFYRENKKMETQRLLHYDEKKLYNIWE